MRQFFHFARYTAAPDLRHLSRETASRNGAFGLEAKFHLCYSMHTRRRDNTARWIASVSGLIGSSPLIGELADPARRRQHRGCIHMWTVMRWFVVALAHLTGAHAATPIDLFAIKLLA